MSAELAVVIDVTPVLSLAMVENNIPLVARISLTNTGAESVRDLTVELALLPDFSAKWTAHVSSIPSGGTFHVDDVELPLDRDKLVNQLERGHGDLMLWVRQAGGDAPLSTTSKPVDVLAYNEWTNATVPHILAAFVQPNHPAVAELLGAARAPLERSTRDPALDGYQSRSPARVAAITQAIYEAIQSRGITYSNPPASFEDTGQKIRTPEQVLTEQLGTCLDLSTLIAAALEQSGLNALIVVIRGHAFPGVWLDEHYVPEGLIDDGALMRKLLALGRLLVFDSSSVAQRPEVPFTEAVRRGVAALADDARFVHALDVCGARKLHFRPLTMRVGREYAAVSASPPSSSGPVGVPPAPAPEVSSGGRTASARLRHPRIEVWKQKLLDTTLRNRLLNYKDTKKSLQLMCTDLAPVEDELALGEDFTIRARPALLGGDDPRSKRLLEARVADSSVGSFLRERLGHHELYSDMASDTMNAKLTTIYRGAREALEETGSNPLCLALGMLDWYESAASEQKRRAPILLLPVALVRGTRTNSFTLRSTGEDARLNVTLFEKIRMDTGITLPELSELPLDQAGVDVAQVLNAVRAAVMNQPRWEVKDELHLGLFSFAKFQMWADLDQNVEAVLDSPIVKHLVHGVGEPYPNTGDFIEPSALDARIAPQDLLCPLDADASQLAAVVAAAEGKTFVLQGPPGTGKSQTITNLIAHCIAQGKRVLFVAEKAAALDVVHRRLTQIGLAPYILELHSHKSGKQQVLEQFKSALESGTTREPAHWGLNTRRLHDERTHLNAYVAALHSVRPAGFSIFQALARLDVLRNARAYELPAHCADSKERFDQLRLEVDNLREAAVALGPLDETPWQGCILPAWRVDLPGRVRDAIDQALARLATTDAEGRRLAAALGANAPATFADLDSLCEVAAALENAPPHGELLQSSAEWPRVDREGREIVAIATRRSQALARLRERYSDSLFDLDVASLAARFRTLARTFWLVAWWRFRRARRTLQAVGRGKLGSRAQIADDLELAGATRVDEARLASLDAQGTAIFGPSWRAAANDSSMLETTLSWATAFQRTIAAVRDGLLPARIQSAPGLHAIAAGARLALANLRSSFDELAALLGWVAQPELEEATAPWQGLRDRLQRWRDDLPRLRHWHAFLSASRALAAAGCTPLARALADGELEADRLSASFERSVYQSWVRREFDREPLLNTFDGDQHARHVATFAELDRSHLDDCRDVARARVSRRIPAPSSTAATGGEMGTLQRELGKKRRQIPIRKLLQEIPELAARLKPCFLMSPRSVAQYLDPKSSSKFDVIVFDEASQIPTYDAIGTLARGRSAVIVGDSKQLPPTSFFDGGGDDEAAEEPEFVELESILDECLAAGMPERRLDWHYRSRHESLIAFSNFHYYRNQLNTFPSAAEIGAGRGVTFRQVTGFYDKGASRTNRAEATAVVDDLVARLRAPDAARRSYGIVTFSQAQQSLVEDLLDRARQQYPEIETFFDEGVRPEPVIVKNLENIQGDERDVMIFSICYGPDQRGVPSMNFGPINREGGERRLNVAVTRAREELVVYSTLLPEHIDLTRTNAVGVKHLKTFLDYARRGPSAIAEALTLSGSDAFDSPFEQEVCERLRERDLHVDTQIGCAGYRIDLGVRHPQLPGKYVLGVECDGAFYHSARSARERDRLREQVLRGLGWTIHRIWSTDWWQDHDTELKRVIAAIERAQETAARPEPPAPPVATQASRPASAPVPPAVRAAASGPTARPADTTTTPYQIAVVPAGRRSINDVHDDRFRDELKAVLLAITAVEAPISLRVLARRVCPYFAIQRTSTRLEERLRSVLGRAVVVRSDIVWRLDQRPEVYAAARAASSDARREAGEIPVEEIANAAAGILRISVALEHDELVKLTARALGYTGGGEKIVEPMSAGVAELVKRGTARRDGNKVVLA